MSGFIQLDGSCKSFGSVQWANAKSAIHREELHKPHVLRSQILRLSERKSRAAIEMGTKSTHSRRLAVSVGPDHGARHKERNFPSPYPRREAPLGDEDQQHTYHAGILKPGIIPNIMN